MSRNYDNWERLVAAVLRRQQLWEICHAHSRTPSSVSSLSSSDFSFNSSFVDFAEDGLLSSSKNSQSLPFQISASLRIDPKLNEEKPNRLEFFEGSPYTFGLEELLMASSNILSDKIHMFSSTYLVSLRHDIKVVVKKYDLNRVTRGVRLDEYSRSMRSVIEHENVTKLRAYYLSKDVMLSVYDYFPLGSVYTLLHGKGGKNRVYLDWETRVRIAFGAAKGIAHIHSQDSGHGNMSSSNVFLNSQHYGCLDDASPFYDPESGYKYNAPEFYRNKAFITLSMHQASDVYSFGVFLIELVSGRLPWDASSRAKTYVDWARHNYRDEWMTLVFDKGLLRNDRVKQQMLKMLEIAMSCIEEKAEKRPDIDHVVVEMLELII